MKLLIVEDEQGLSGSMVSYLGSQDYLCETAADFDSAMNKIDVFEYACIILDIGLPGGSGLELLRHLKSDRKQDGVIIISAKNSLDDKINGLKIGADDYLTKPFHLPELAARVDAIIRRKHFGGSNIIRAGFLDINLGEKTLAVQGRPVVLTRKEYDLLLYLVSNKNKVISKNALAEHIWGDEMDLHESYDFIYTHIKNLRRKLEQAGADDHIQSIYGMGYKFRI